MLSTIHDDKMVTKSRRSRSSTTGKEDVQKPVMVDAYNNNMGGVDKSDQLLAYYGFNQRTIKWYKRAIFHLFDLAIINAFILYKLSSQGNKQLTHLQFRIQLAHALLTRAGINIASSSSSPRLSQFATTRLYERHFLEKIPLLPSGKFSQLECIVCSNKKGNGRRTTTYQCKQCELAMCVVPCFELYHTHVDPMRYL